MVGTSHYGGDLTLWWGLQTMVGTQSIMETSDYSGDLR